MAFQRLDEAALKAKMAEKQSARDEHVAKLVEKYSKSTGLAFGNGKLEEMMEKDARKTSNLLIMLENTEKKALSNKRILENMAQAKLMKDALSESQLKEAVQAGNAAALLMPSDIVKISRIAYTNAIAEDIFDVWGMESMKDSIWKLETTYGSTERGATAGDPIVEKYNDGRYSTTKEQTSVTAASTTPVTLAGPVLKYRVSFLDSNGIVIGADDGFGTVYADVSGTKTNVGTVDYAAGTFTGTASTPAGKLEYVVDFENQTYMKAHQGSVLLNLIEHPFQAVLNPMKVEWTRFAEDLMQSKMGFSAKETLIAGAGEEFKKAFDEKAIAMGIRAADSWASSVSFDADWATASAVSSYDYAQNVNQAFQNAENKSYKELGRFCDSTNMIVSADVYAYLTKNKKFNEVTPTSKVGMFKVGEMLGRGVYLAPDSVLGVSGTGNGVAYLFGKNANGMNVDSPVSIGVYGTGITTPQIEYSDFTSEMGLGCYSDMKIMNNKMATKVVFTNLDKA